MRNSKTLKKIRQNQCARVCGLGHYLPFFVRYAAHYGYDVIWLDLEHRAMTDREVQSLLGLCYHNDIDCMVRPSYPRTNAALPLLRRWCDWLDDAPNLRCGGRPAHCERCEISSCGQSWLGRCRSGWRFRTWGLASRQHLYRRCQSGNLHHYSNRDIGGTCECRRNCGCAGGRCALRRSGRSRATLEPK